MREWLMVLATLAVSITYAAGLNPPGGMWQDDSPGHHTAGTPVLQTNAPSRYLTFYYTNAMSFVTSLVIVALLLNRKPKVQLLLFVTLLDLMCLVVAYLAGTTSGVVLSIPLILVAVGASIYVANSFYFIYNTNTHTQCPTTFYYD
ncbi:uncharacterized protein [Miscanthus floridulus]|uniref:uncharacterized protein n=1 Tax=Miscanthus floridulus TaxID=154761 RepID=UPI00345A81EA